MSRRAMGGAKKRAGYKSRAPQESAPYPSSIYAADSGATDFQSDHADEGA